MHYSAFLVITPRLSQNELAHSFLSAVHGGKRSPHYANTSKVFYFEWSVKWFWVDLKQNEEKEKNEVYFNMTFSVR